MKQTSLHFEIAENILYTLNQTPAEFISQIRLFTALQLFKTHKLSWGQAANLANLTKEQFLGELDQYQIPLIDYDAVKLTAELKRFQTCEESLPIPHP